MAESPPVAERLFWPAALGLLLLFVVLSWLGRPGGVQAGQDDAIYLFLARSLRALGYHDIYYVDRPLHHMYPPGYPALLAVLGAFVGERIALVQALGIAAATGALALIAAVLRRLWSSGVALVVLAAQVVNPHLVGTGAKIGTDATYLLLSMLAVALLARRNVSPRLLVVVGAMAIMAALTRSVGIALLAGIWAQWMLERRFAAAALFTAAGSVTVGSWLVWTVVAPEKYVGRSYIADAAFTGGQEVSFAVVLLARVAINLTKYFAYFIPNRIGIPPLPGPGSFEIPHLPILSVFDLLTAVAVAVGLVAGLWVLWKRWRAAALYVLAYGAMLAIWPWSIGRFLNVLIPLLVVALLLGTQALAQRVRSGWGFPVMLTLGLALVLVGGLRSAKLIAERSYCEWGSQLPPPECRRGELGAFFSTLEHIKLRLPPEAVIVSAKPAPVYYFTERKTIPLGRVLAQHPEDLIDFFRSQQVQYVILGRLHTADYHQVSHLLERNCEALALEAAFEPHTYLFRVLQAGVVAPDGAACAALTAYREAGSPQNTENP
ncbi:MAG: hypothetical protein H0X65_08250 [Gemmatimonadetes bacterium]|nr:hypothetical protein [Gemmatimonadota bacterium]